jgi:hypothetical protein
MLELFQVLGLEGDWGTFNIIDFLADDSIKVIERSISEKKNMLSTLFSNSSIKN